MSAVFESYYDSSYNTVAVLYFFELPVRMVKPSSIKWFIYFNGFSIKHQRIEEVMVGEKDMLKYMNLARQFPHYFIALIDQQLAQFTSDRQIAITPQIIYETNEGQKAWHDARQFLQQQTSLPAMQWHEGLARAAEQHAKDLAEHNTFGHSGSDGSNFSQRILSHCKKGQGAMAEIIGPDFLIEGRNNAEMTVLGLIIDDGVTDRGHCKTIFNPNYRHIGCSSQPQNDKVVTVFNLTEKDLAVKNKDSSAASSQSELMSNTTPQFKPTNQSGFSQAHSANSQFLSTTQPKNFSKQRRGSVIAQPFKDTSNQQGSSANANKMGKVIQEKIENTRIYTQGSSHISEKVTKILYKDGTTQEQVQKRTIYA